MTLYINGFMRGINLTVNLSKRRIIADMSVDVSAILPSAEEGVTVYFFEKYVETLHLFSERFTVMNESSEIYAKYRDEDGSIIQDSKIVHFFEKLTPSFSLSANPNLFQEEEGVEVSCKVKNENGGLATNTTVYFFEKMLYDYFNKGNIVEGLSIDSGVSVTSEDGALKITTSTNGEKRCSYPFALTDNDNYTFECTIAKIGVYQSIAMYIKNSTTGGGCWFSYEDSTGKFNGGCMGSSFNNVEAGTLQVGDKITIKRENGVITLLLNDTTIYSKKTNFGGTYYIGHYTNKDRIQYVKNIKIIKE